MIAALPLLAGLQFTISATLAGGASMTVALIEIEARLQRRRGMLIFAAGLFLAGLLIRPMGAACGAIAAGLFFAPFAMLDAGMDGARFRRHATILAVAAAAFTVAMIVDGAIYRSSAAWDAYNRYNWMTARLFEWGGELPPRDVDAIRTSVGWSLNDWRMLQAFWGVDPNLHGFDRVANAYARRVALVGWDEWLRWMAGRLTATNETTLRDIVVQARSGWVAITVFVIAYASRRTAPAAALGALLFAFFCVAIAAAFKELPFRLLAPLHVCAAAAIVMTAGMSRRKPPPLVGIIALSLMLTVLVREVRTVASELYARRPPVFSSTGL